jgi:hypothetical protein
MTLATGTVTNIPTATDLYCAAAGTVQSGTVLRLESVSVRTCTISSVDVSAGAKVCELEVYATKTRDPEMSYRIKDLIWKIGRGTLSENGLALI